MEAKLAQASTFKRVLDAIKDLVAETNFDCSAAGIAIQAMDSSHVCLISLLLRPEGFEEFRCHRPVSLGVSLTSMAKIMKCAGNDDTMTISCAEGSDLLGFKFVSPSGDKTSRFELRLMDINGEALGIGDMNHDAVISMPSSEFQRICRDMSILSDTVTISAKKDRVTFGASGDVGNGSVTLQKDAVNIELKRDVSASFALRYLNFFAKATSLSEKITISLVAELPLVVEYAIANLGYVRYYLAPKVEDGAAA